MHELLSDVSRDIRLVCECGHQLAHHLVAHTDQPKESCTVCDCQSFRLKKTP